MLEFEFRNVGGNNPHQMKIIHSKYGSLTTLHMTHEEAEDLFYKLTAYKDRCERIGGYDDPKLEGVKEPSERSRSPSNQSKEILVDIPNLTFEKIEEGFRDYYQKKVKFFDWSNSNQKDPKCPYCYELLFWDGLNDTWICENEFCIINENEGIDPTPEEYEKWSREYFAQNQSSTTKCHVCGEEIEDNGASLLAHERTCPIQD